jgi:DNA polymerase-3 subunit gamma/tau
VLRAIDLLAAGLSAVKDGSDPRIQLELALLKAVQPQSDMSIQALLFRIEQLERKLAHVGADPVAEDTPEPVAARGSAPSPRGGAPASAPPATVSTSAPVSAPATASAASAVAVRAEPEPAPASDLDLDRLRALWPAVVDEVCKGNQMVGAFLAEARPTTLEANCLVVCFAPGAGFSKKKVESNRQLVQGAVRALTGAGLDIRYELSDLPVDEAAPSAMLSEEDLLERLKQEFGAKEVFDE